MNKIYGTFSTIYCKALTLFEILDQACATFLVLWASFTVEKLLSATCIFTKIKLQVIVWLFHKMELT